jgi:hypothetical protein
MSYYKKSDVKNHLSTGAVWPPASLSQRTEAAVPQEDDSPDVNAGTRDAPEVNPVSPPQKSLDHTGPAE